MTPENLKYTEEHEWLRIEGTRGTVGITEHAQHALGDITFVELPEPGAVFNQKEALAVIESAKVAADVFAPASGEIVEINGDLEDAPELVNEDPYGSGWLVRIEMSKTEEADIHMTARQYEAFLEKADH